MRTGSFGRTAINVKLEKVTNDIADIKKGKPMTFAESNEIMVALSENTSLAWIDKATGSFPEYIKPNERYMSRLMSWFDDTTRLGTIKIMNLSDCFLNKNVVDFVLEERK